MKGFGLFKDKEIMILKDSKFKQHHPQYNGWLLRNNMITEVEYFKRQREQRRINSGYIY